jgi:hypothetical protein
MSILRLGSATRSSKQLGESDDVNSVLIYSELSLRLFKQERYVLLMEFESSSSSSSSSSNVAKGEINRCDG